MDLSVLKFVNGLIPVITQDIENGEILMQAFANEEAIEKTIETGFAHYYSRSRKKLWKKGEESGHVQKVFEILLDCDGDSIIYKVHQTGAACHTNNRTCFYRDLAILDHYPDYKILDTVNKIIKDRIDNPKEGSYTNYLLYKGTEKICKKIGEEATEVVIAAMKDDKNELACEISDLFFHIAVLMADKGISSKEIYKILEEREGLKPKAKYKNLDKNEKVVLN